MTIILQGDNPKELNKKINSIYESSEFVPEVINYYKPVEAFFTTYGFTKNANEGTISKIPGDEIFEINKTTLEEVEKITEKMGVDKTMERRVREMISTSKLGIVVIVNMPKKIMDSYKNQEMNAIVIENIDGRATEAELNKYFSNIIKSIRMKEFKIKDIYEKELRIAGENEIEFCD